MKKRQVYLDNASTTPLDGRVLKAMMPYLKEDYGNPSNLYEISRSARKAVVYATEQVARALHCEPDEVVFTGSATEADNLAIIGTARANKDKGNRIIISAVEHKGIMAVCGALEKEGFEVIKIPVGKDGLLELNALKKALNEKTILVSITMADSETGTLQPIKEIAKIINDFRAETNGKSLVGGHYPSIPYFHTDASQAAVYADVDVQKLGIDMMTLSAHKLGGPKGIGGLFIRRGVKIEPIIYGGGQQGHLRSGTEDVPAIVGFGAAMELNDKDKKKEGVRIAKLRDALQKGIFKSIDKVVLNGHHTRRLPNFLNISILDIEGESLLLELDEHGIMVNTGSACNSQSLEPSYVLTALGNPYEFVHGSIRFTLGRETTMAGIDHVLECLPHIVERLRSISPLSLHIDQKSEKRSASASSVSEPRAFVGGQGPHFLKKKGN